MYRPQLPETSLLAQSGPFNRPDKFLLQRNIPACAERTEVSMAIKCATRKHPCLRRADFKRFGTELFPPETSLLAQSGRRRRSRGRHVHGNIPACAERTSSGHCCCTHSQKHPCLRRADIKSLGKIYRG